MGSAIPSKDSGAETDIPHNLTQQLLRTIAHDLRTPITVLRGYLKMLLTGRVGALDSDQKEYIETALGSVDQLTKFAGVIGGIPALLEQFNPEPLNLLTELWRAAWRGVEPQAVSKSVAVNEKFPHEPLVVSADRRLLSSAIEALAGRCVASADSGAIIEVEGSRVKPGTLSLGITISGIAREMKVDDMESEVLSTVFLHGGQLTIKSNAAPLEIDG